MVDANEVKMTLKEKKEKPIHLPQLSKIIIFLLQEIGYSTKRTLIIKCFESVA